VQEAIALLKRSVSNRTREGLNITGVVERKVAEARGLQHT